MQGGSGQTAGGGAMTIVVNQSGDGGEAKRCHTAAVQGHRRAAGMREAVLGGAHMDVAVNHFEVARCQPASPPGHPVSARPAPPSSSSVPRVRASCT